jgi:hypothetical protein
MVGRPHRHRGGGRLRTGSMGGLPQTGRRVPTSMRRASWTSPHGGHGRLGSARLSRVPSRRARLRWLVSDARSVGGASRASSVRRRTRERTRRPAVSFQRRSGRLSTGWTAPEPGRTYSYRLEVRGTSGVTWWARWRRRCRKRINALAWRAAWPNPFGRRTQHQASVARESRRARVAGTTCSGQGGAHAWRRARSNPANARWSGTAADSAAQRLGCGHLRVSAQVGGEHVRMEGGQGAVTVPAGT